MIKKNTLDEALKTYGKNYVPTYGDIKYLLPGEHLREVHTGGWRLEYFVIDLMLGCKEGLIDDSPNFGTLLQLLSQKSSPISAALAITIDMGK